MSGRVFAGVLAAGHGTRFQAAGVTTPKALVTVGGRSLVQRTLDAFSHAGFARVTVVVNELVATPVREHLRGRRAPEPVLHVKTTASTLETFTTLLRLASAENAERFLFTTVDAMGASAELARFAGEADSAPERLVLGVAPIEPHDDSPLRVALAPDGGATLGAGSFATVGFYAGEVKPVLLAAEAALAASVPSLRVFLTQQAAATRVRGIALLGRTFDVDTPDDVVHAERALARGTGQLGGIE